jgi:hypothetical protein
VLSHERHAGVVGCKVLDVVLTECEPVAETVGRDGGRWRECIDGALYFSTGLRENRVEAEDICNDTCDVFEFIAELG